MCCFYGPFKKPKSGLAPESDPQTPSSRDSLEPRRGLLEDWVEDTHGPIVCGSSNESTRSHPTSHVSILQGQFENVQSYRNLLSSERNAQQTELWADNASPSFTTAENAPLMDVATAQSERSSIRTSNSCQSPLERPRSSETFRVPYIFEFVPFPGHICTGRGTIPLGTVTVSVDGDTKTPHSFKYDASFQRLFNDYNYRNRRVFAIEPVELHHVTEVSLQSRVEFRALVKLVRDIREKKILVVTLLKRYPGCPECRDRGRLHDVTTP